MATVAEVRERLERSGCTVTERQVSEQHTQLHTEEHDGVVNVWSTGTCSVQGRDGNVLEALLGELVGKGRRRQARPPVPMPNQIVPRPAPREVFVVYGHDKTARTEADAMLRRWGLEPLILDQLPSHGNTIIEKLEHYQQGVSWAIVLLTPDDLGHPTLDPTKVAPRPRQNVVLEMGMLLGKLGRQNVAMIYKRSDPAMELPSDIQGYIYIPYVSSVEEASHQLAKEMSATGFYEVPVAKM